MRRALVGMALALAGATPLGAQDTDVAAVARTLREQLAELGAVERELMPAAGASRLTGADDGLLARRNRLRATVAEAVERLVVTGTAGRQALTGLAADHPSSDLVRRAEIRAALRADDATAALRLVDALRVTMPRDTQLVRWRAEACERLGRGSEALQARQAYWELAPENGPGWRALVRAHEQAGTLARLRESVSRLRVLHPDSRVVREQEIEILHRLGRYDEAARVAAATGGDPR